MKNTYASTLSRRATAVERRLSLALLAALLIATVVTLAYQGTRTFVVPSFIAIFVGSTGTADALAAGLLFSLYYLSGQNTSLYSACAYLLNTLLIVPYTVTFPGVIDKFGFIGNEQSAAWVWIIWHVGFGAFIFCSRAENAVTGRARRHAITIRALVLISVFALAVTLSVTLGRGYLPILVRNGHFTSLFSRLALSASFLNIVALITLLRAGRLSTLRLWLVVALAASALDTALNVVSPGRYSASWYVGKIEQFVTASIVLISMLAAWAALNARSIALAERLAHALAQRRRLQTQFNREHRASKAFQDAALPITLPTIPGITFSAVYRAAHTEARIGGDWYDAFRLTDGRVVLSVGDVMGSGLAAAVTMNAVRQAIRGATQIFPDPLAVLDAADRVLRSERPDAMVTAFVAVFDPVTLAFSYASAGHPPALLLDADGRVTALGESGLPLGLRASHQGLIESTETIALPDPSLLVLYTDGLTEVAHNPIDGELQLRRLLMHSTIFSTAAPADKIANELLDQPRDDVAILTMRLDGVLLQTFDKAAILTGGRWTLASDDAERANAVRREVARALALAGASEDDIVMAELVYSELVGNVLRHSGSAADIALDISTALPVLHILDRGPGFAYSARLPTNAMSESGRGLFIVSTLTSDFNVVRRSGGGSHARAVLPFKVPGHSPQRLSGAASLVNEKS